MKSYRSPSGIMFHHHSDFSGEVLVSKPATGSSGRQEMRIPASDLVALVVDEVLDIELLGEWLGSVNCQYEALIELKRKGAK